MPDLVPRFLRRFLTLRRDYTHLRLTAVGAYATLTDHPGEREWNEMTREELGKALRETQNA